MSLLFLVNSDWFWVLEFPSRDVLVPEWFDLVPSGGVCRTQCLQALVHNCWLFAATADFWRCVVGVTQLMAFFDFMLVVLMSDLRTELIAYVGL